MKAEPIGEFDLLKRLLVDIVFAAFVPRPWRLHFIKQAELHNSSVSFDVLFLFVAAARSTSRAVKQEAAGLFVTH